MAVQRALVFLDASVLVAASRSPSGGSALAMEVCRGRRFRAAFSARVLLEARVNIAEKFGEPELVRFYQLVAGLDLEMVPPPSPERLARCLPLVGKKDAHVLAAALECGAGYLLTLDRRHLMTPAVAGHGPEPGPCQGLVAGVPGQVQGPGEGAAVDIHVQQPRPVAPALEDPGQAYGGGGLADAALHAQGQQGLWVGHSRLQTKNEAAHGNLASVPPWAACFGMDCSTGCKTGQASVKPTWNITEI